MTVYPLWDRIEQVQAMMALARCRRDALTTAEELTAELRESVRALVTAGAPVADVARLAQVSRATVYDWMGRTDGYDWLGRPNV